MDDQITARLLDLNLQFYQTCALQFSATRQRLQPGVKQLLPLIVSRQWLLDLGCGNGELARRLAERQFTGTYLGIDQNADLLGEAEHKLEGRQNFTFVQANLVISGWQQDLVAGSFDLVLAFAVLHHIPGADLRRTLLMKIHDLLAIDSQFIHSEWQPFNSSRLRERIRPWESIGLKDRQLEAGDFLIDWRAGGSGLRYIHVFTLGELEQLASASGFAIQDSFLSDGEGGRLGLYQVWKRV